MFSVKEYPSNFKCMQIRRRISEFQIKRALSKIYDCDEGELVIDLSGNLATITDKKTNVKKIHYRVCQETDFRHNYCFFGRYRRKTCRIF